MISAYASSNLALLFFNYSFNIFMSISDLKKCKYKYLNKSYITYYILHIIEVLQIPTHPQSAFIAFLSLSIIIYLLPISSIIITLFWVNQTTLYLVHILWDIVKPDYFIGLKAHNFRGDIRFQREFLSFHLSIWKPMIRVNYFQFLTYCNLNSNY